MAASTSTSRHAPAPRRSAASTASAVGRRREDEPQVAGAFRQGVEPLPGLGAHHDAGHVRHLAARPRRRAPRAASRCAAIGTISTPAARGRRRQPASDSPTAARSSSRFERQRLASRRPRSGARGRTARQSAAPPLPAPRPRRRLTRHSAWIGPCQSPAARAACVTAAMTAHRRRVAARRRRDVERLFEERTVERVGLVEHRQHVQRAVFEHALERHLESRHESLDLDQAGRRIAQRPDVGRRAGCGRHGPAPPPGAAGSSARMTPRLPDSTSGLTTQGNGTSSRRRRVERRRHRARPRRRAGRRRACRSRNRRLSRLARAPSTWCHGTPAALGDQRRQHHRPVADRDHAVESRPRRARRAPRRTRRRLRRGSARDGPVAPRIVEVIAAIGGQHQLDAERGRRLVEAARLVAGRRRAQQHATRRHPRISVTGSSLVR